MSDETIEVTIPLHTPEQIKVEAKGIKGAGCKALTQDIEKAIGTTVEDKTKPEMYQAPEQKAVRGVGRH